MESGNESFNSSFSNTPQRRSTPRRRVNNGVRRDNNNNNTKYTFLDLLILLTIVSIVLLLLLGFKNSLISWWPSSSTTPMLSYSPTFTSQQTPKVQTKVEEKIKVEEKVVVPPPPPPPHVEEKVIFRTDEVGAHLRNLVASLTKRVDSLSITDLEKQLLALIHEFESAKYTSRSDEIALFIKNIKEITERMKYYAPTHAIDVKSRLDTAINQFSQCNDFKEQLDSTVNQLSQCQNTVAPRILEESKNELIRLLSSQYITKSQFEGLNLANQNTACPTREEINKMIAERMEEIKHDEVVKNLIFNGFLDELHQSQKFKQFVPSLKSDVLLEDIKSLNLNIDAMIEKLINQYVNEDILNRRDFAAISAGARIANYGPKHSTNCGFGDVGNILKSNNDYHHKVREAWCFKLPAFIDIELSEIIYPSAVTVEFISHKLEDSTLAPKTFEVYGKFEEDDPQNFTLFGTFGYSLDDKFYQTFEFNTPSKRVSHIRVKVNSNHGNQECTCIYRIRVHGEETLSL